LGHSIRSYERALRLAREKYPESFEISGDCCLVAIVPQEDLAPKSAILIASGATKQVNGLEAKRPVLVRVLEVGPGFYKDDGTDEDAGVKPGDTLLVGMNSVSEISQFGKLMNHGRVVLGLCNASERLWRWPGDEAFNAYFDTLVEAVANE
jgi:hypothetical protein